MKDKYIVIVGNVVDGLTFYGPIEDPDEVTEFTYNFVGKDTWVVATLTAPPERKN